MQSTFWLGTSWKMNKTLGQARKYATTLALASNSRKQNSCTQLFIVPPHTALALVCQELADTPVIVGAQNMHWAPEGAYTGEISAQMIRDCGASLVELGHSERRAAHGETDVAVNLKVHAALRTGLRSLICVGDSADERRFNVSAESVIRQVKIALHRVRPEQCGQVLLAYEPVWAIGEGGTPADPRYVNKIHTAIRKALAQVSTEAACIPILYGGSVNSANAVELSRQPEVNGLFIGRSAWEVDDFLQIEREICLSMNTASHTDVGDDTEKQ